MTYAVISLSGVCLRGIKTVSFNAYRMKTRHKRFGAPGYQISQKGWQTLHVAFFLIARSSTPTADRRHSLVPGFHTTCVIYYELFILFNNIILFLHHTADVTFCKKE